MEMPGINGDGKSGRRHRLMAMLGRFRSIFSRMLDQMFAERRWLVVTVVLCDMVAAAARIGALLLVAAAVGLFSSNGTTNLFVFTIVRQVDLETVIIFGVAIGIAASAGALASYQSARQARRLGRWMNLRSMRDISDILSSSPTRMMSSAFKSFPNLNVVLTQVPIHSGLAAETMARLAQPIFMMVFAGLVLLYQQPLFTAAAALLSLSFIPVILRQSSLVQRNARGFYSAKSYELGYAVTTTVASVTGQHGIIGKSQSVTDHGHVSAFFDSYDINLLANERVGLIVAMADAILRPVLFIVLSALVLFGEFSIQAVIGFLGSLAYLLASARTVASLLTNLLRYHPQVVQYYELLDAVQPGGIEAEGGDFPISLTVSAVAVDREPKAIEMRGGETAFVAFPKPLSSLTLAHLFPPFRGDDARNPAVAGSIAFVSSVFRFAPVPLMDQLCAQDRTPEREAKARALCEELGAAKGYEALNAGYETQLSESVWNSLDAAGRVAFRLVPLCMVQKPAIVAIDMGVIQALGMRTWPLISREFADCFVFLIAGRNTKCPAFDVDYYFQVKDEGVPVTGDRSWFDGALSSKEFATELDGGLLAAGAML